MLLTSLIFTGEKLPIWALALGAFFGLTFIWLGNALHKEVLAHQYTVHGAPIASSVARDLKIEVKA